MLKKSFILLIAVSLCVIACKTVPLTGRRGLKVYPSSEVNAMSFSQYSEVCWAGMEPRMQKIPRNARFFSCAGYCAAWLTESLQK